MKETHYVDEHGAYVWRTMPNDVKARIYTEKALSESLRINFGKTWADIKNEKAKSRDQQSQEKQVQKTAKENYSAENIRKEVERRLPKNDENCLATLTAAGFVAEKKQFSKLNQEYLYESAAKLNYLRDTIPLKHTDKVPMEIYKRKGTVSGSTFFSYSAGTTTEFKLNGNERGRDTSYEEIKKDIKHDIETAWHMPASDENLGTYTSTHEYGHMVHNDMMHESFTQNKLKIGNKVAYKEALHNVVKEFMDFAEQEGCTISEMTTSIKQGGLISEYGMSNYAEFFAETFANAFGGAPNKLGYAMIEYLKRKKYL